ncbi:MAG: hypothetical protein R3311_02265, partial [Oceanisphaera sp.]|nr:hypothetical protein [Oceanisphaera sp.]
MPRLTVLLVALTLSASNVFAAPAGEQVASKILFRNVNVFDGKNNKLHPKKSVLVEGDTIKAVSQARLPAEGATVIEGDGRTLMPGMIDAHAHIMINAHYTEI